MHSHEASVFPLDIKTIKLRDLPPAQRVNALIEYFEDRHSGVENPVSTWDLWKEDEELYRLVLAYFPPGQSLLLLKLRESNPRVAGHRDKDIHDFLLFRLRNRRNVLGYPAVTMQEWFRIDPIGSSFATDNASVTLASDALELNRPFLAEPFTGLDFDKGNSTTPESSLGEKSDPVSSVTPGSVKITGPSLPLPLHRPPLDAEALASRFGDRMMANGLPAGILRTMKIPDTCVKRIFDVNVGLSIGNLKDHLQSYGIETEFLIAFPPEWAGTDGQSWLIGEFKELDEKRLIGMVPNGISFVASQANIRLERLNISYGGFRHLSYDDQQAKRQGEQ